MARLKEYVGDVEFYWVVNSTCALIEPFKIQG